MRWAELHLDDVVLGADRHEYIVVERFGERFLLQRLPTGNKVSCSPPPDSEVTLVRRADHRTEQLAAAVLINAGFQLEIIGECRQ